MPMPAPSNILVVDDEGGIRSLVKEILEDEGYRVDVAEDAETARASRRNRRPDLIPPRHLDAPTRTASPC